MPDQPSSHKASRSEPISGRDDFLRKFDELIQLAEARPFMGRRKVLRALLQVRRQRGLR